MPRTDAELQDISERIERKLDELDPAQGPARDSGDLRAITEAVAARDRAEAQILERVQVARSHGRSWNLIAMALGVSRQAARERFAEKVHS